MKTGWALFWVSAPAQTKASRHLWLGWGVRHGGPGAAPLLNGCGKLHDVRQGATLHEVSDASSRFREDTHVRVLEPADCRCVEDAFGINSSEALVGHGVSFFELYDLLADVDGTDE
eukprot:CAMPEP_0206504218 /NCGR_PEP_ID=MMETSP0324_2-20121206/55319_1 /ASSEMBLY_ACC=CAM_ASM_000836 /TAXON_ID=2866 /ORGANISM="Crypthecodinium cohnii, Strain Seligo" /LENGTH=115 /DNA_ID=CAMNT_0053993275 /DNA_START=558 /DNA_END=902 /DNA_ORIENTATION=+